MDDIFNHKFIICGGDGLNPLGIIRSLGEVGIHPYVISNKSQRTRPIIARSRYIEQVFYAESDNGEIDLLINVFGNEPQKPFVFITDEWHSELLDRRYDEINGRFYFFNAGYEGRLIELTDKSVQCQLASSCGLTVPRYEVVIKGQLPTTLNYPVISKTLSPNEGQWKKDMRICNNKQALITAYTQIEASRLILEEYVEGIHEYDLKGISIDGGREVCFTYAKLWNSKTEPFGTIMHYEPCKDTLLMDMVKAMMRQADYSGIFDIEFIRDKAGNLYFLEVNWRTGMYNFNHTENGFNIPYLWALFSLSEHIDVSVIRPNKDNYTSFDEIAAFSDCLRNPKLFGAWIRALKESDYLFYFDRKDMKPCVAAWLSFFRRKIQLLVHRII